MFPSKFLFRTLPARCMTLATLAMLFALPAQAANNCDAQQGGIGGTGAAVEHGGIGGTGNLAQGSGMGGTGAIAQDGGIGGTGITGIITGFASICVNGMEVHYDSNTPLEINGQPATANDLAVGQLVYAEAIGTGDEVVARNISVRYAVSGPVTHVNNGNGQIRVMGQTVQLTGQTINSMGGVQPGDFVRVSGLRKQDGVVMAARVERAAAQNEVSVSGQVSRTGKREFNISGLRIAPEGGKIPEGLATGREVHVRGQLQDGLLKAEKIEVAPALPFGGREQRLELQGYVRTTRESGKLHVGETQMEISPQAMTGGKPAPDQLVRVSARLTPDKRIVVEHIEPVRDYFQRNEPHDSSRKNEHRSIKEGGDKDNGKEHKEKRSGETRKSTEHDHRSLQEKTDPKYTEDDSRRPPQKDGEHTQQSGRAERLKRIELSERLEKIEKNESPEKIEKIEKVEKAEKTEKIEKPEKIEKVEKMEKPEKIEKIEKVERIEKIEVPERIERVEIERPESH